MLDNVWKLKHGFPQIINSSGEEPIKQVVAVSISLCVQGEGCIISLDSFRDHDRGHVRRQLLVPAMANQISQEQSEDEYTKIRY